MTKLAQAKFNFKRVLLRITQKNKYLIIFRLDQSKKYVWWEFSSTYKSIELSTEYKIFHEMSQE